MKIVFLERAAVGKDIDLSAFEKFGEVVCYDTTLSEEVPGRVADAEVVVINRLRMNEESLKGVGNLKLIAITATGTNMIDWDYVRSRGIQVENVRGYSTNAVAQHTFALTLALIHKICYYDRFVKSGGYCGAEGLYEFERGLFELQGKTWGIIGMGAIGRRVAALAENFGCNVIYYSTSGENREQPYECVDLDGLLARSDILSIHAPLNEKTEGLLDRRAFAKMKSTGILINVGRGPIVNEGDLAEALKAGQLRAAGLDVLSQEPMNPENPLLQIQDSSRLLITPHMAWTPVETRKRVIEEVHKIVQRYVTEKNLSHECPTR